MALLALILLVVAACGGRKGASSDSSDTSSLPGAKVFAKLGIPTPPFRTWRATVWVSGLS